MENISGLNERQRYPFDLEIYPYLRDHHLEKRAILPAVESLIILAGACRAVSLQRGIKCIRKAAFSRFLYLAPDNHRQPAVIDIIKTEGGNMIASLLTSVQSKTGTISRHVEHARAECMISGFEETGPPPFRTVDKLKGSCISIPSAAVYRDLVPFGIAYQNIIGDLSVSSEGALGYVSGGNFEADDELLGSPFPLDAVMHAACVWGQRFAGKVCFPVGFEKRLIYQKTEKGQEYLGRVVPVSITRESLIFDVWIYKDDVLYESVSGIIMKDVTNGRMNPPDWIKVNS